MTEPSTSSQGRPSIGKAALLGLCPECGASTLFAGPISFAPRCAACGLDYSRFNVGDGPAAILIMLVGAIIVPAALVTHFTLHPPLIVHLILWPLLTLALKLGGLRLAKGWLLASEHQRESREGRLASTQRSAEDAVDEPELP